jgi:hypothetical protein
MSRSDWREVRISGVFGVLAVWSTLTFAQQPVARPATRTGTIDGVVTDTTLAPLAGATVSILGSNVRVVTNNNGRFRISGLRTGPLILVVQRLGFEPMSGRLDVAATDTARVSFSLERITAALDTVVVTGESILPRFAEFEARRRQHEATASFDRDDILKVNPVDTWQMLSRVPALRLIPNGPNGGLWAVSTRGMKLDGTTLQAVPCFMTVMVDGVMMAGDPPPPGPPPATNSRMPPPPKQTDGVFDMTRLPPPDQIHGIEVFGGPASIPVKYSGAANDRMCGLIVIWTR